MKELIEDYRREQLSRREWIIYGVIAPAAFVLLIVLFN